MAKPAHAGHSREEPQPLPSQDLGPDFCMMKKQTVITEAITCLHLLVTTARPAHRSGLTLIFALKNDII